MTTEREYREWFTKRNKNNRHRGNNNSRFPYVWVLLFALAGFLALVQCNCEAETLTRQGVNREHEVEGVLPKLALFEEYQEQQQELVEW